MLDQELLKPVVISMVLYLIIAKFLPEILKKPVGIAIIDDLNMFLIAQQGSLSSGVLLTGLIVLITQYIMENELV